MSDQFLPRNDKAPPDDKDAGQRNFAQLSALGDKSRGGMPNTSPSSNPIITPGEQPPDRRSHP